MYWGFQNCFEDDSVTIMDITFEKNAPLKGLKALKKAFVAGSKETSLLTFSLVLQNTRFW